MSVGGGNSEVGVSRGEPNTRRGGLYLQLQAERCGRCQQQALDDVRASSRGDQHQLGVDNLPRTSRCGVRAVQSEAGAGLQ